MLLVEQNARAALSIADRGCIIETGRLTASGALLADSSGQRSWASSDPGPFLTCIKAPWRRGRNNAGRGKPGAE